MFCKTSTSVVSSELDRCAPKQQTDLGRSCIADEECKSGLTCTFTGQDSVCVDKKGLAAGTTCNPSMPNKCGVIESDFSGTTSLKCLPKGTSSVCQVQRGLYESCSGSNVACGTGLTCDSKISVCFPSSR